MIKSLYKKRIITLFLISTMCLSSSWVVMATGSPEESAKSVDFMISTGEELKTVLENADKTPISIHITEDIALDGIDIEIPEEVDITIIGDAHTLTKSDGRHFIFENGNLSLENIVLEGESNGGGVEVRKGNLTISNGTVIQNCFSQSDGGGVYVQGSRQDHSTINVSDSTIVNNTGSYGGGLFAGYYITLNIINSEISSNTGMDGGGIYLTNEESFISEYSVISDSKINDNMTVSNSSGGGIGTMYVNLRLSNNEINGNKASEGGGICAWSTYNGYGIVECNNTIISNNIALDTGGGMKAYDLECIMSENEISGNTAERGGGVSMNSGSFTAEDCNITNNIGKYDCGVHVESGSFTFTGGNITNNTTIEEADED